MEGEGEQWRAQEELAVLEEAALDWKEEEENRKEKCREWLALSQEREMEDEYRH